MDLNSTYTPPINNACVPDIFNRLDADVIERTRVANNQLNMRLLMEQKVISKYRQEAEKFLLIEKSRVRRELARITQTIPSGVSIRDLDEKIFETSSHVLQRKRKNYLFSRNDDPVCRRCYIHHLPTKKKFYNYNTPPPPPIAHLLHAKQNQGTTGNHSHVEKIISKYAAATTQGVTRNGVIGGNELDLEDADDLQLHDQTRKNAEMFLPPVETFKFLVREKWGRERDLNHTPTPRLLPNEIWKHVVNNVSSQCSREHQGTSTSLRRQQINDIFFRGRVVERKAGTRSRRQSLVEKYNDNKESFPRKMSKSNSRINLFRRPSIANEGKPDGDTMPAQNSTRHLYENPTFISASSRSSTAKIDTYPRSLSRTNSTLVLNSGSNNTDMEAENVRENSKSGRKGSIQSVRLSIINKDTVRTNSGAIAMNNRTSTD